MKVVTKLLLCAMLVACVGCASPFAGEWLEEGRLAEDGSFTPAEGTRMALRFEPPATVRYGSFADGPGVVDHRSVHTDAYFEFEDGKVAQFGAISARLHGKDYLIAYISEDTAKRFVRVKGPSIFPPKLRLPALSTGPAVELGPIAMAEDGVKD